MTIVYVDAELLVTGGAGAEPSLAPDATALGELVEQGHRPILVGSPDRAATAAAAGFEVVARPADGPGWYLTTMSSACSDARSRGLRPLLVGPSVEPAGGAGHPFDETARDLHDAMLRILADEAMGGAGRSVDQPDPPIAGHDSTRDRNASEDVIEAPASPRLRP